MKIRRLEIQGFKSFADRTVLRFGEGITGVVGPNGCGKSNIVDAIRWVMGEQSAKHLRGAGMQDVIFSGSESRGPSGLCEVTITFKNDGELVPPEWAKHSEIAVTRRLFRDGTSEYALNKVQCRLRDILDLFMGTGIGKNAYSIIEQGRIGLIVTAKAEDRRAFIEDAAGVSRYKARRKQAERRIQATEQNLVRITDITDELSQRLATLERQAKKAEKYKTLRAELKDLELHAAAHRYLELESLERFERNRLQTLKTRIEEDESAILDDETRVLGAMEALEERGQALRAREEKVHENQQAFALAKNNAEYLSREHEKLTERRTESDTEFAQLKAELIQVQAEHAEASALKEALHSSGGDEVRSLEEKETALKTLAAQLKDGESKLEKHKREMVHAMTTIAEHRNNLSNLDRVGADLSAQIEEAKRSQESTRTELESVRASESKGAEALKEAQEGRARLLQRKNEKQTAFVELKRSLSEAESKLQSARDSLIDKRSRLNSLEKIQSNYERCTSAVRTLMRAKDQTPELDDGLHGLVADVVSTKPQFELAVEAVLGDRLQSIIVENQDDGLNSIEFLKGNAEGRSSFIPLDLREDHTSWAPRRTTRPPVRASAPPFSSTVWPASAVTQEGPVVKSEKDIKSKTVDQKPGPNSENTEQAAASQSLEEAPTRAQSLLQSTPELQWAEQSAAPEDAAPEATAEPAEDQTLTLDLSEDWESLLAGPPPKVFRAPKSREASVETEEEAPDLDALQAQLEARAENEAAIEAASVEEATVAEAQPEVPTEQAPIPETAAAATVPATAESAPIPATAESAPEPATVEAPEPRDTSPIAAGTEPSSGAVVSESDEAPTDTRFAHPRYGALDWVQAELQPALTQQHLWAEAMPSQAEASPAIEATQPSDAPEPTNLPDEARAGSEGPAVSDLPVPEAADEETFFWIEEDPWPDLQQPGVLGRMVDLVKTQPGYEQVARVLLGDVLVVQEIETARRLWRANGHRKTIVTLTGEVLDPVGVLTGGSSQGVSAGMLAQKREIKELKGEAERLTSEVERLQKELATHREDRTQLDEAIAQISEDFHRGELQVVNHERDLAKLRSDAGRMEKDQRQQSNLLEGLLRKQSGLEGESKTSASTVEKLELTQAEAEKAIAALSTTLTEQREKQAALSDDLTQLKVKVAANREKRDSSALNLGRVEKRIQEIERRMAKLSEFLEGSKDEVQSLAGRIQDAEKEGSSLEQLLEKERAEVTELRAALQTEEAQLKDESTQTRARRKAIDTLKESSNTSAMKAREHEIARATLESQIEDRYRLELRNLVIDYHALDQQSEKHKSRAVKLRKQLDNFGPINLTAIDEFKEVNERYSFLAKQREDLEAAITSLRSAIRKINRTSKERYVEAFRLVNEKFQQVFPKLFNGGRAALVMNDESDPLESGIEMLAQPPGKKLQSVNLLSGGEKALTAVALIFAIFLIKPTPFCLLDEVDAPLDEANVGRYNEMLREMSAIAQFILITHNKRTMELPDRLYGVTMEEPGISKIVPVDIGGDKASLKAVS